MPLSRPIEEYESVETWGRGLREQWGGDPLAEEPDKVQTVAAFCEFIETDPDELVAFCFLRRKETGERFGSVKRREQIIEQVRAFREQSGLEGVQARKRVNDVLSFLIHNGVLINARAV